MVPLTSRVCARRQNGTTNLITRALAAVGKRLETVPDPTSVFYHLPASEAHPQVWPLNRVDRSTGGSGRDRWPLY